MSNELDLSWFELSKYEGTEKFTLKDWYIQLARRIGLKTFYDDMEPKLMLLTDGGMALYMDKGSYVGAGKDVFKVSEILEYDWEQVKSNPTGLYTEFLSMNAFSEIDKAICLTRPRDLPLGLIYTYQDPEFFEPINSDNCLISIDLNAPEKVLIEQFKTLVREQKQLTSAQSKKSFTGADLKSWHALNILPCIDLMIYEKIHNVKINQGALDNLLFPNEFVTDKSRRSVLPKVKEVFSPKNILAMQYAITA